MARLIWNAKSKMVTGRCGHEVYAYIPPSGGRPGPVGRKNIEKARQSVCYNCRTTTDRYLNDPVR